ncbi:MAG: DegV family EDD domain-containing protein [Lachnospiraceae bacterium]|nr:DegV family EDD domain-containing protein [Lachnospiraceae bacterium]
MKKEGLRSKLYNNDMDIRQRLFVLNVLITEIILGVDLIEVLFTDEVLIDKILLALAMAGIFIICLISVKAHAIKFGSAFICIVVGLFFVPITFINGGGINGDAPLWFIYVILMISILLNGKTRVVFYILEMIVATGCYYISVRYPELIFENTRIMGIVFSYVSLIMISVAMAIMVVLEINLFTKEKKRTEEQKKEIEMLNAAQNQFFSSMSHEIRTPINTIIGLNEMILRENVSDEVVEDAVNIRSAGKLLLNLINDILDMSKFRAGKMHLLIMPYQTGNMLSDLVGMLWIRAKEKNLEFRINVSPDVPAELVGDDVRIKQILINILNNAIKYTKEGSISLTVQSEKIDEDTYNIIYTVADTGIGIKKEDMPYLFSAFKRVDEDTTNHIEGTGLGLSIVKQFLDLMGGKITVNSVYTKGSTFIVEIPQKRVNENLIGEFDFEKKHGYSKRSEYKKKFEAPEARILVVDDNEANLMVVNKLLRDTKVIIDTVTSGKAALKKTQNIEYNVIFMDHLMPEMDGIECKKQIRNQVGGSSRESKIVVLTANADEENRELYVREAFDGYLAKPVSGEELEKELYRLLPKDLVKVLGDDGEIAEETISWMHGSKQRKMVAVSTESVADIPGELIEKYGIQVIPHKVQTAEGVFKDGTEIDTAGVIKYMEETKNDITPMAPEAKEHELFFAKQLAYANNVIHIAISSKIGNSGFPPATDASKAFDNVFVVDSGHLSSSQGLIVLEAARLAENGMGPKNVIEELEKMKKKVHTSFIVDNLDYLARAKQVSARTANLVKSLMGRPVLVLKKGRMKLGKIYFGSSRSAWKAYINSCLSNSSRIDTSILFVTYVGLSKKDMDWIREYIEKSVKFDEIYFQQASASIAVNCGPGTFGLLYKEK